jgi:hypothetical protein
VTEATTGSRLDAVRRATTAWTGQLVDLTGRNSLLYYRDLKVGTLPLDTSPRQLIYSMLAGRPVSLGKLFSDEKALEDAVKRARTPSRPKSWAEGVSDRNSDSEPTSLKCIFVNRLLIPFETKAGSTGNYFAFVRHQGLG